MIVSYSGIGSYNKCPSQFARRYVMKEHGAPYMPAPAAERGTEMHQSAEDLINGHREDLPPDISMYTDFFKGLRDQGAVAEEKFCFNSTWESLPFDTDQKELTTGVRGMMDITLHVEGEPEANVYELKTGKEYDDHPNQRNLYGMVHLLNHPELERVKTTGVYMDLGYNRETVYHQSMMSSYKYMWERKINKVQPPQPYPMRPGWYCRFCPYSKSVGGKCPN